MCCLKNEGDFSSKQIELLIDLLSVVVFQVYFFTATVC